MLSHTFHLAGMILQSLQTNSNKERLIPHQYYLQGIFMHCSHIKSYFFFESNLSQLFQPFRLLYRQVAKLLSKIFLITRQLLKCLKFKSICLFFINSGVFVATKSKNFGPRGWYRHSGSRSYQTVYLILHQISHKFFCSEG